MNSSDKEEQINRQLLLEERESSIAEAKPIKENPKLDIQDDEKPVKDEDIELNPYVQFMADTFTENQKQQSDRAKSIVESGDYKVKKVNGEEVTLTYNMLNRKQDVDVRSAQRKWVKLRQLGIDLRDEKKEFNVKDYISNPFLKGQIDGDMSREAVLEIVDTVQEEVFQERLAIYADAFFGISPEQIDDYIYKELTFILDVAYSSYSTVPY